jgi:hypothetical protein
MNDQAPPPLPDPNSAFRTYLRAGATLIPTVLIWLFAGTVLVPKLEQLWRDTGLTGSRAQWLMDVSDVFHNNFYFIVTGLLAVLLLVEFRWAAWPRYRRGAVTAVVVLFHTAVLVGITTIATAALLAAPLLLKHK